MKNWKNPTVLGYKISQSSTRILTLGKKNLNECDLLLINAIAKNIIN